jgi:hypothetical protein
MSLAIDAASTANSGITAVNSFSWTHNCSGSNRLLIACLTIRSAITSITTITYSGLPMTLGGTVQLSANAAKLHLYYLIAPPAASGSHLVSATFNQGSNVIGGATSWTGAHQSVPLGTVVTNTGSNSAPTVTASSAIGEVIQDMMASFNVVGAPSATVGGGQTQRWNAAVGVSNELVGAGSTEAGAASVTMSWSLSASASWAILAVPILPLDGITIPPTTDELFGATQPPLAPAFKRPERNRVITY